METYLAQFYENKELREAVQAFLIDQLGKLAVTESFAGRPTQGIVEAKKALDNAFTELAKLYARKAAPKVENQSR